MGLGYEKQFNTKDFKIKNIIQIILAIIGILDFYLIFPELKERNCILAGMTLGEILMIFVVGILVFVDSSRNPQAGKPIN